MSTHQNESTSHTEQVINDGKLRGGRATTVIDDKKALQTKKRSTRSESVMNYSATYTNEIELNDIFYQIDKDVMMDFIQDYYSLSDLVAMVEHKSNAYPLTHEFIYKEDIPAYIEEQMLRGAFSDLPQSFLDRIGAKC